MATPNPCQKGFERIAQPHELNDRGLRADRLRSYSEESFPSGPLG